MRPCNRLPCQTLHILLGIALCAFPAFAEEHAPACSEVSDNQLAYTGNTSRTFLFFNIYDIQLHVDTRSWKNVVAQGHADTFERLLHASVAKQLRIAYSRNISADRVREVLRKGFMKNASDAEGREQEARLQRLLANIDRDIAAGDSLWLSWQPKCGLSLIYNGSLIWFESDAEFARILLAIWLGEHSVVDRSELWQWGGDVMDARES